MSTEAEEPSDIALMERVRAGSEEAFFLLVDRYKQPLVNFFHRLGASSLSEDLVQETFLRLWRSRERYRPTAKFRTFLYTLAKNARYDDLRKLQRRERTRDALEQERQEPEAPPGAEGLDVEAALATLSDKLRPVVVLKMYQGLQYDEIAEVLGIAVGTAKSRMHLAVKQLKEFFDEHG